MSNELQVFKEQEVLGKNFRIYGDSENPLFLAKDVADWIEHSKTSMMVKTIDEDEKLMETILTSGQKREMLFLTENGVYEVLFQSRKPIAKEFKKKVKEILKDIRKHGMYMNDNLLEQTLDNPDFMIEVLTKYKEEKLQRQLLEQQVEEQKPLVTFAEKCIKSKDSILVRELAKIISDEGYTIGEKGLYKKLREWGLILKAGTEPSQKAMNQELFEVTQGSKDTAYGIKLFKTTKVTPKGQVYIIEKLMKEKENSV